MKPPRHLPRCAAFTLIEVLIALVILSTGIVVVLQAFQTSATALGDARDTLRATRLIADKLSELDANGAAAAAGTGVCADPLSSFRWRVSTGPAGGGLPEGQLNQVTVEVWRESSRVRQSLSTYRYQRTP